MARSKKQVRETTAGKSISVWVVLDKDTGAHVATIQAHLGSRVTVDVYDRNRLTYRGAAGGGGYDKLAAALAGAVVGGHTLYDHCEKKLAPPDGAKVWPSYDGAAIPPGYRLANYSTAEGGWTACFADHGLRYLEAYFTVIQAI